MYTVQSTPSTRMGPGGSRRGWNPNIPRRETKPFPRNRVSRFGDIDLTYQPTSDYVSSGLNLQFIPEVSTSTGLQFSPTVSSILDTGWVASLTKGLEITPTSTYQAMSPVQINPISQGNSMQSGGALPILQNIVSGASNVLGSYLNMKAAKTQAQAITGTRTVTPISSYGTTLQTGTQTGTQTQIAGLPSNWAIYAIIGIGAFLVFRGRKSENGTDSKKRKR